MITVVDKEEILNRYYKAMEEYNTLKPVTSAFFYGVSIGTLVKVLDEYAEEQTANYRQLD